MIFVVGDLHSSWSLFEQAYWGEVANNGVPDVLIQVGDLNFVEGFEVPRFGFDHPCFFIDGNHDELKYCLSSQSTEWKYIPRWTVVANTLFVGGARSYDENYRRATDGSYSPDEVLEPFEVGATFNRVISHTCPSEWLHKFPGLDPEFEDPSCLVLSEVLRNNQVLDWWFGHWHHRIHGKSDGCRWRALGINEFGLLNDEELSHGLLNF